MGAATDTDGADELGLLEMRTGVRQPDDVPRRVSPTSGEPFFPIGRFIRTLPAE